MPAPSASPFYFKSDDTFYSTRKASAVVLDLCAPLLGCCSASKGVVVDQSLAPWDFDVIFFFFFDVMLAIAHCARQGIIEKSDDRKKASTQPTKVTPTRRSVLPAYSTSGSQPQPSCATSLHHPICTRTWRQNGHYRSPP